MSPSFDSKYMRSQALVCSQLRKPLVEHPLLILIAIALITIGFSKHKKKESDAAKFKTIAVYYAIALVLILAVIPWHLWFSS